MCYRNTLLAMLALLVFSCDVSSHEDHRSPEDLPDELALTGHVEHADIIAGRISMRDVLAAGEAPQDAHSESPHSCWDIRA